MGMTVYLCTDVQLFLHLVRFAVVLCWELASACTRHDSAVVVCMPNGL